MRADGSIKSLITGVTTQHDKYQTGEYHALQENFLSDNLEGLRRRPALQFLAAVIPDYDPTITIVYPVEVRDELYFIVIVPNALIPLYVFDADGISQVVGIDDQDNYLGTSVTSSDDLALTVSNDTTFIVNRKIVTQLTSAQQTSYHTSYIHVRTAPTYGSIVKATLTDVSLTVHTATITIPEADVAGADTARATNQVAIDLAAAINALTGADTIAYAVGSTIGVVKTDDTYADISIEDGNGGDAVVAINGSVQTITHLPAHAGPNSVIKVQPDTTSNQGQYFMRGVQERTDDPGIPAVPSPTLLLTVGEELVGSTRWIGYNNSAVPTTLLTDIGSVTTDLIEGYQFGSLTQEGLGGATPDTRWILRFPENSHLQQLVKSYRIINNTSGVILGQGVDPTRIVSAVSPNSINYVLNGALNSSINVGDVLGIYINVDFENVPPENYLTKVTWVESAQEGSAIQVNHLTMPHTLIRATDGSFNFGPAVGVATDDNLTGSLWSNKTAGDDLTNRKPAFIDKAIQDIAIFQKRLTFLVDDTFVTSQTDDFYNIWKKTATTTLEIDPVSIASTAANGNSLRYFVPHNKDMLIFSKTEQYKVPGNIPLTPQTAALPLVTTHDVDLSVRPTSIGSHAFFPFKYGATTGISKFTVQQDSQQDLAVPITHHVSRYIGGNLKQISGSQHQNIISVNAGADNELFIFEFDSDMEKQLENSRSSLQAWSRWLLPEGVITNVYMYQGDIYVLLSSNLAAQFQLNLYKIQLSDLSVYDESTSVPEICLDFRQSVVVNSDTYTVPATYPGIEQTLVFLEEADGAYPYTPVEYTRVGNDITFEYAVTSVTMGVTYTSRFQPLKPLVRDAKGLVQSRAHSRITQWLLSVRDTPQLTARIVNKYEAYVDYEWEGRYLESVNALTDIIPTSDEVLVIPYKQNINHADLELRVNSPWGANLIQLEWEGAYTKAGRRF